MKSFGFANYSQTSKQSIITKKKNVLYNLKLKKNTKLRAFTPKKPSIWHADPSILLIVGRLLV